MLELPLPTVGGEQLRDAVRPRPHTIASLARTLGLSTEAVRRWALGIAKPRPEHREQLERLLGIPASSWDEPALTELPAAEPAKKRQRRKAA